MQWALVRMWRHCCASLNPQERGTSVAVKSEAWRPQEVMGIERGCKQLRLWLDSLSTVSEKESRSDIVSVRMNKFCEPETCIRYLDSYTALQE